MPATSAPLRSTPRVTASRPLPAALYQCQGLDEQCRWVEAQLNLGRTLTDPGIWLAGAEPDLVIRTLRQKGLAIKTVRKKVVDAADEAHMATAWRLYKEGEKRPAGPQHSSAAV